MTGTTSAETSCQDIDFLIVWQLLTKPEQAAFWRYASQHARELKQDSHAYKPLCVALRNAEYGKNDRRTIKALPSAPRRFSPDDMRIRVAKTKAQLLDQPNAELFLIDAFCNWIQDERRNARRIQTRSATPVNSMNQGGVLRAVDQQLPVNG